FPAQMAVTATLHTELGDRTAYLPYVAKEVLQVTYHWRNLDRIGDCGGLDYYCTPGVEPMVQDPKRKICDNDHVGQVSVCWSNRNAEHPFDNCRNQAAWCTYKAVTAAKCTDNRRPGAMYECTRTVGPPK